jgi:hypothetical protein
MTLLLGRRDGIIEDAEDGTVRDGAERPLPIIVIGKRANGAELHDAEQGAQSDVDVEAGARAESDFLAKCREKRRCRNFQAVEAG